MSEKKIYVGKGNNQGKGWLKCTINPDKLKDYIQEYEGHKYVKLNINIYDEPDQYGKDVKITIDEYKQKDTPSVDQKKEPVTDDSVPF